MRIAIIGKHGALASALQTSLASHHVSSYGKEEYNFAVKEQVSALADNIQDSEVIIYTAGVYNHDVWDTYLVNTVGPAYLLEQLSFKNSKAHVILIGSHSAMWTSWPGISLSRLSYNTSKNSLQTFVTGLNHSKVSDLKLSLINVTKFQSTMSANTGHSITAIVDAIINIVNSPTPVLLVEMGSHAC